MEGLLVMALGAVDGWSTPLLALLSALIIGMWLAGLINIARSRFRSPVARWGWVAVVTLLPVLGFLIYQTVGSKYKVDGSARL